MLQWLCIGQIANTNNMVCTVHWYIIGLAYFRQCDELEFGYKNISCLQAQWLTNTFKGGDGAGSTPNPTHMWSPEYHIIDIILWLNATTSNILPSNQWEKAGIIHTTTRTKWNNHFENFDVVSLLLNWLSLIYRVINAVFYCYKFGCCSHAHCTKLPIASYR